MRRSLNNFNLSVSSTNSKISEPVVYIKGYKVDRDKLKATYGSREDDPENTRFLAIWEKFPLDFKYPGSEKESDEDIALVLVLDHTIAYCPIHESFYCGDLSPYLREVSKFITAIKSSNFSRVLSSSSPNPKGFEHAEWDCRWAGKGFTCNAAKRH